MSQQASGSDGTMLQNRRFLAYIFSQLAWKGIIFVCLYLVKDLLTIRTDLDGGGFGMWSFMFMVVVVSGFIDAGFIGGETWLARYTEVVDKAASAAASKRKPPGGGPTS